jgi:5'-3' exonuclease
MINLYLKTIVWISKYYFESCKDWLWQYPYHHAPFISDITNFLNKYEFSFNDIKFKDNKNINCFCQLLSILPPESKELLPKSYQELMNKDSIIKDLFPDTVIYDTMYKDYNWQAIPLLPYLNIERIINATSEKRISKNEKQRCLEFNEFFLY